MKFRSPIDAKMYGVENRTTMPIEVTLNVSKSNNCEFNTQNHTVKKVI